MASTQYKVGDKLTFRYMEFPGAIGFQVTVAAVFLDETGRLMLKLEAAEGDYREYPADYPGLVRMKPAVDFSAITRSIAGR